MVPVVLQAQEAGVKEAWLQGKLEAMTNEASLLPDAMSQLERCNTKLGLNEKVILALPIASCQHMWI